MPHLKILETCGERIKGVLLFFETSCSRAIAPWPTPRRVLPLRPLHGPSPPQNLHSPLLPNSFPTRSPGYSGWSHVLVTNTSHPGKGFLFSLLVLRAGLADEGEVGGNRLRFPSLFSVGVIKDQHCSDGAPAAAHPWVAQRSVTSGAAHLALTGSRWRRLQPAISAGLMGLKSKKTFPAAVNRNDRLNNL